MICRFLENSYRLSLFVSLLQAFFVKLKLNLAYIAVGQAKIRGVTPNLLKNHILTTHLELHKYPCHTRNFSIYGHFNENILPKTRYLKRKKEIQEFI